ncbi:jg14629 [Pararge aegeria aegeria]|uniref:Jg14629 protein n=1 Tax=Pararge aegeria aegeria TaxID=348720 RepID=A0A8S4RW54_9NEOP|nr:jg14629 [Pararge aegeria aegeria]
MQTRDNGKTIAVKGEKFDGAAMRCSGPGMSVSCARAAPVKEAVSRLCPNERNIYAIPIVFVSYQKKPCAYNHRLKQ